MGFIIQTYLYQQLVFHVGFFLIVVVVAISPYSQNISLAACVLYVYVYDFILFLFFFAHFGKSQSFPFLSFFSAYLNCLALPSNACACA